MFSSSVSLRIYSDCSVCAASLRELIMFPIRIKDKILNPNVFKLMETFATQFKTTEVNNTLQH